MCVKSKFYFTDNILPPSPEPLNDYQNLDEINRIIEDQIKNIDDAISVSVSKVSTVFREKQIKLPALVNREFIQQFDSELLSQITLFLAQHGIRITDLYGKAMDQNDAIVPEIVADEHGQLVNSLYTYFTYFEFQEIEITNQHIYSKTLPEITVQNSPETLKIPFISLLEAYLEIMQYYFIDNINLIETYLKLKIAYAKCLAVLEN